MFVMCGLFMAYDVIIIGAEPDGIFSAYELVKERQDLKADILYNIHVEE